ncbi:chemotaxis protein, partial [Helicobacter jaachi]
MFKYLSLKYKIIILALGSVVSFIVLVALVLRGENEIAIHSTAQIQKMISEEVEQKIKLSTDSLADSLGALIEGKSEAEQIDIIAKAIEKFRFEDDKSGYYFAYKEYVPVAHPTRKDLIGKSLAETKDANGVFYVRELYQTAKEQTKEGKFVHFVFSKPLPDGSLGNAPKVAYATLIPHTQNIWLSTGVYIDTLEVYAQNNAKEIINDMSATLGKALVIACVVFLIIFVPLVLVFYRALLKSVGVLQHNIMLFFRYLNHEVKDIKLLPLNTRDEFGQMAAAINQNIEQTNKNLDQDTKAIEQSAQTAKEIESG